MNYDIHYLTQYRYQDIVTDNLNALRVQPATNSNQRCDEFHVRLDPEARIQTHKDYFGTEVLEFGISRPHDHLTIDVRARVVTSEPKLPLYAPWERLNGDGYEAASGEFLLSAPTDPQDPLTELLAATRMDTPLGTLQQLCIVVPQRFLYQPGATYVGSTVDDLLIAGAGVCQDFAHLSIVLLRRHGIAARYVSGYLFSTKGGGDETTESVEVQTHAWIEALMPGDGDDQEPIWVGADPTNSVMAGETHVKIGHGRNYTDVPPTKGVYFGSAIAELEASVQMTRLDRTTSAKV